MKENFRIWFWNFFNSCSSDASEESNEDKPTPDEPLQKTEAEKPEVDCDSDSGKINKFTVILKTFSFRY